MDPIRVLFYSISGMTVLMLASKYNVETDTKFIQTAQVTLMISCCLAFRGGQTLYYKPDYIFYL